MDWGDIIRSDNFKSLYQVHYFFLYLYYHVFGINSAYYFFWFVFLFSVNLTLFYTAMAQLFSLFGQAPSRFFFLLICILLLTAPNNFENVTWAATSHYNLGMLLFLVMLHSFLRYIDGAKIWFYFFYLSFLLSLFTIEMSLLFPIIILLIIIFYSAQIQQKKILKHLAITFFVPSFVLLLGSFLLLKILNNELLPHGASLAGIFPSANLMVTNFWMFCMQGIAYTKFVPNGLRDAYYAFVHQHLFWPLLLCTFGIIFYCIKAKQYLFLLLFLSMGVFLLPNLFRFGMAGSSYENVRFVFFALPFILTAFLVLLKKNVWILSCCFVFLVVCNFIFLNQSKQDKIVAGKLHAVYIQGVAQHPSPNCYLLNIPSFCKQFFVYRSIRRVGIEANMRNSNLNTGDYTEVMWYYAQNVSDSFSVEKIDNRKLAVLNHTDGVWLMHEHFGASPYENDGVIVSILEWGGYTIEFKNAPPADTKLLLYSNGRVNDVRHILD